MSEIAAYENNMRLFFYAEDVAKKYGIFSKFVVRPNYSDKPDMYLVFSLDPIEDTVNPVEIINRNKRNTNLFFPESHAVNINAVNPLLAWEEISYYLSRAEFMCELYREFQVPLPKKIRDDELDALITFYCGRNNPNYDMQTRRDYAAGLREYFKQELSRGKFKKEWQEFYRSELFDKDKSFVKNFIAFLKRKEPETTIDVLLESSSDLKKTYISEHHYEEFRNRIKTEYPDVKYNVSDKIVVDKGVIVDPKTNKAVKTQYGITVTDKEYDQIRESRFAVDGFKCLDGLNLSRSEGRNLFYKASDENIIASVLNDIRYRWARCHSLDVLKNRDNIEKIDVPVSQLGNFYVAVQQYGIPIVIDNDVNNNPTLDVVHVLYNSQDAELLGKLVAGITYANIYSCHVTPDDIQFDIDVDRVDALIDNAKKQISTNDKKVISNTKDTNDIDLAEI